MWLQGINYRHSPLVLQFGYQIQTYFATKLPLKTLPQLSAYHELV